jgi:hypothetical protein
MKNYAAYGRAGKIYPLRKSEAEHEKGRFVKFFDKG